ncbi:MAG: winged helix-turn-helix transcriptional regulator [Verrucomicrobiae bacterium]|nr:winged helix-turn-helix transcriptional regulator [Verrucomicrobiae bacterium]
MKRVASHRLPPEALELVAARFRALGEPLRLQLLNRLMEGECTVSTLVEATGAGQANVSKHLGVLREAGLVAFRKEGAASVYRVADPGLRELCDLVCRRLGEELAAKAAHFQRPTNRGT